MKKMDLFIGPCVLENEKLIMSLDPVRTKHKQSLMNCHASRGERKAYSDRVREGSSSSDPTLRRRKALDPGLTMIWML